MLLFGDYKFEIGSNALYRAEQKIPLRPKAADLLELFLRRPGEVLAQKVLAEKLWPDLTIDYDQQIRAAVLEIRKALGDDPETPRFIETIPRRGYRFIAPVSHEAVPPTANQRRRVAVLLAAIALIVGIVGLTLRTIISPVDQHTVAYETVLAVLPIRYAGQESENNFPAEGVTHALIARLTQNKPESVAIIGRTSVLRYDNTNLSIQDIASELGANMLLETTYRQIGREPEVSATLVESTTGRTLWSLTKAGGLKSIEDAIVSGLLAHFSAADETHGAEVGPYITSNPQAYEAYIIGLHLASGGAEDKWLRSLEYFQQAVARDPEFALAHVGVARTAYAADLPRSVTAKAIERALEIDDKMADAYFQRGRLAYFDDWNYQRAESDLKRAIELRPDDPVFHAIYSTFLRSLRRFEQARAHADIAITLDPLSELVVGDYEWLYLATGKFEEAIRLCERGLAVGLSSPSREHQCLTLANFALGKYDLAADHALDVMRYSGASETELAQIQEFAGRQRVEALRQWELDQAFADEEKPSRYFTIATRLSFLGQHEEALGMLEKSVASREFGVVFIAQDPFLTPLAQYPRFQDILDSAGLPVDATDIEIRTIQSVPTIN